MATKISKAQTRAVYRGKEVSTFAHDLSNYSELRRGLSPSMRAQTMTKTELRQVSPDVVERYINQLNQWRTAPQQEKATRAAQIAESPLEEIFATAAASKFFSPEEKATLLTANLKVKLMTPEQAKMELKESLNVANRLTSADFYKAKYYLDEDEFDPEQATDNMLYEVIMSGYIDKYPDVAKEAKEEYLKRLQEAMDSVEFDQQYASEANAYKRDILGISKSIFGL